MGAEMVEDKATVSPAEEKEAIKAIMSGATWMMAPGDKFYLLSARWWKLWQGYTDYDDTASTIEDLDPLSGYFPTTMTPIQRARPPAIDNFDLVATTSKDSAPELKDGLAEESDYMLLPEEAWKKLHGWYGGGPVFERLVISVGQNQSNIVEVYPLKLKMVRPGKIYPNGSKVCVISRQATVKDLWTWSAKAFNLEESEFRLWDFFDRRKGALLSNPESTLEDAKIQSQQQILVEERKDGIWPDDSEKQGTDGDATNGEAAQEAGPLEPSTAVVPFSITKPSTYLGPLTRNRIGFSTDSDSWFGSSGPVFDGPKGLTGLANLGNTCFMNSALQCLTHTPQLVDYFLQDFTKEINRTNPLGMKGELAAAFGELLRKLWAGSKSPVAPRAFKAKLAHFAPQFSGYNQHDSQELLAFLLDGLHEDLNRVKKKPYVEAKDSDGRPDEVVADEAWEMHKARNDSVIVDVCQGQYKSTLVCPECEKTSITFDPFMYLSLPLPDKTTRTMTVTVYSGEGLHAPQEVTVTVRKSGRMKDVHQEVVKKLQLRQDEELILAEVYQHKVWQWIELTEYSAQIKHDDTIAAFRVPKGTSASQYVLVYQLKKAVYSHDGFATPLLAPLPKEGLSSSAQLHGIIETLLRPYERKRVSTSDSDETGNDTGAGPSQRAEENDTQGPSSSQEIAMTEVDEADDDNGLNEATSGKSGTEHYEDAEDADANGDEDMDEVSTPQGASAANRMSMDSVDMGAGTSGPEPGGKSSQLHIVKTIEKTPTNIEELAPGPFPSVAVRGFYDSSRYPTVAIVWREEDLARYDMDLCTPPSPFEKQEAASTKPRGEEVSLAACLASFLKEEPLGVDDMWYCPTCKTHRQASKKLDLWRLPEVLVVHLKRFSYTRWHKSKLDTFVDFPMDDLDLEPYSAGPKDGNGKYELFAVSNHFGGMGGGHYTANAKVDNEWYNFDDSHVGGTSASSVRSSSAYVLFYRRKYPGASSTAGADAEQLGQQLQIEEEGATVADPAAEEMLT